MFNNHFINGGIIYAQDDVCTRETVIASFAEAAAKGEVETWAQNYASGNCPAVIKEGVQTLAKAFESRLMFKSSANGLKTR